MTCGGAHIGFVGESLAAEMMILPSIGEKFTCALDRSAPTSLDARACSAVCAPN